MNDSNQELFRFLMEMVPRNMNDVSNSMNLELVDIRKNLIRKSRIITEFRYFLKRYLSDSKTEKKIRKFEADFFNSPTFKKTSPTDPKSKTIRKSISIDQEFLKCFLINEEIIGFGSPLSIKKSNKASTYGINECFIIDSEDNFISYLFSPKEATPFLGLSLVSQNSSVIINYIHEKPLPFIQCLIKNQNHPNYVHITQSIIPSIFGYFSSLENLDCASNFYIKLLSCEEVTPDIAIPILAPFFNSPASYRFTEKLYSEFFRKIVFSETEDDQEIDNAKIETQNAKISPSPSIELNKASSFNSSTDPRVINARLLNSCILKAVPLLPIQFFNIFKQLRVRRWTMHDWYNLFFREFILISMNQWIRSSFCDEYVEILFNIMSRKFVSKKELAILFKSILNQTSIYEPPQLFQNFKSPSTLYLLNIRNMQILVSFLSENKILPPSVDTFSFGNVPQKYKYMSFWCNVYSRRNQSSSSSFLFTLEEVKKSENDRLVFQSFDSIRDEIENEEKKSNLIQFQKEFRILQTLAEKYGQTNTVEFMLKNSGKGEFHQFAQLRCLKNLIDLADDFEETMELLRQKDSISEWISLVQSNENMLVLSHISMFEKRMDVVQSMPTFIKQAIFLNRIDESKFKRFSDSFHEIGSNWDMIVHSPHFSPFKYSSSLSYAPSPTIKNSKEAQSNRPNMNSNINIQKKKSDSKKRKIVNSSSSPNLSNLNDNDDDKSPNMSELSSDTENPLFSPISQNSERENKIQNLRKISINYSNSEIEKNNDQNLNDGKINIHMSRSMSSDGLFINKTNNKLEPFSPLSHLPNAFFETLDLVSLISHVRLPEKFFIMMKVLEQIEFFSNQPKKTDFSLLVLLLQNIPGQIIIPMYIVLNVFAMREPNIFLLCSEQERKRWLNFEQIVLKCASENFGFLSKLLNLQSEIQDEFNKWKDKNFKNW